MTGDDLRGVLAALPGRRAWLQTFLAQRNARAVEGRHAEADLWALLAEATAEVEDHERAALSGLDFTPGVEVVGVERPEMDTP